MAAGRLSLESSIKEMNVEGMLKHGIALNPRVVVERRDVRRKTLEDNHASVERLPEFLG